MCVCVCVFEKNDLRVQSFTWLVPIKKAIIDLVSIDYQSIWGNKLHKSLFPKDKNRSQISWRMDCRGCVQSPRVTINNVLFSIFIKPRTNVSSQPTHTHTLCASFSYKTSDTWPTPSLHPTHPSYPHASMPHSVCHTHLHINNTSLAPNCAFELSSKFDLA